MHITHVFQPLFSLGLDSHKLDDGKLAVSVHDRPNCQPVADLGLSLSAVVSNLERKGKAL